MLSSLITRTWNTLHFVARHPLNRQHALRALSGFARWQVGARLVPGPVLVPLVEDTKIFASPGLSGATGTVYVGLQEFEEMAFLLHLLRPHDRFADVGANVGSYSILAAGVAKARVVAFEPAPAARRWLSLNIALNDLAKKIDVRALALGRQAGQVSFTSELDTVNHVAVDGEGGASEGATITVPVDTLDHLLAENPPTLLKVDVEGFEAEVFEGGAEVLRSDNLLAVIVEINGSGARYGHTNAEIHAALTSAGLSPYGYDPRTRSLRSLKTFGTSGNTLYLRRIDEIERRLRSAGRFRVGPFGNV